jgi:cellulose synthase/poly-beta-1,6-N-acetylglucosamine synthase-like glycosyltransferase
VFTLAACLLAYLLAGYPLLLAFYPWRHAPPIAKDPARIRLVTILLPVYNGEAFLRTKLESILGLDYPGELLEVLVISDASTDATDAIAGEFASAGVRLLRVPRGGKAAALNAGIQQARGEILFFTDVRQRLAPDSLRHLVACLADPSVGSVTGELHIVTGDRQEEADMGLYWRYEVWARKQMTKIDSIFGATGCIYAMPRELVEPIPPDTLGDDAAFPLAAFFRGYRMILDVEAKAYDLASPLGSEFERRMRTLAGLWQNLVRRPELLGFKDRMWLHFLSHKAGRLLLPWLALTAFTSAFWLPAPWRDAVLAAVAAFLGLAVIDFWLPQVRPLKRITSPARTTLVMLAASLCSISVFLVSPHRLWKRTRVGAQVADD